MMNVKFRNISPIRTFSKVYSVYQRYKPHLREDFYCRCGYTDCPDFWFGGPSNFHIDHFIPWKNHPTQPNLKNDYGNLVYCCSFVNILKSNDEGGYLDPCETDYNNHFYRNQDGAIVPNVDSVEANYMYTKLKLYLSRYRIIWMLESIYSRMEKLNDLIDRTPVGEQRDGLSRVQGELAGAFIQYMKYLRALP